MTATASRLEQLATPRSARDGIRQAAPAHTGSKGSRVLGVLCLVGLAALVVFGLFVTKPDQVQGDAARMLYLHVPVAVAMILGFVTCTAASALWLWKRTQGWDVLAASAAEVGIVFTALTLVTGALWGKPIWGVYWAWDPRLTTFSLLFLLYLGYLTVRRLPADPEVRNKRSALIALFAFIDVPIMYKSVDWWRGLHQRSTIGLDSHIEGLMLFTLVLGIGVMAMTFAWLLIHRFRLTWLEEQAEAYGLEGAIAARRAEAEVDR